MTSAGKKEVSASFITHHLTKFGDKKSIKILCNDHYLEIWRVNNHRNSRSPIFILYYKNSISPQLYRQLNLADLCIRVLYNIDLNSRLAEHVKKQQELENNMSVLLHSLVEEK